MKLYSKRPFIILLSLFVMILLSAVNPMAAQEVTPEATPADVTPEPPPPTVEPTLEPPTAEPPPLEPTQETPTPEVTLEVVTPETTPVVLPTLETTPEATPEQTAVPTSVAAPPVFNLPEGDTFEAVVGIPLTLNFSASDEAGAVRVAVMEPLPLGNVTLTLTDPVEITAPFSTLVELLYLPPANFTGADLIQLTAINPAGVMTSVTLTVNVLAAAPSEVIIEPTTPAPTQEIILHYDPAATEAEIQALLAARNAVELKRIPAIGAILALVPVAMPMVAASSESGLVSAAAAPLVGATTEESVGVCEAAYIPNDSLFKSGAQWNLKIRNTNFPEQPAEYDGGTATELAWDLSTARGTGVVIAVLDTGVDLQHPELKYKVVPGWDFVNEDAIPDDDDGHGTLVAGIIAAAANNTVGVAGIAYNAKIMPLKVCVPHYDEVGTGKYISECSNFLVAAGIVHAVDKGAKVINLSLTCGVDPITELPSETIKGAVNYALSKNVVVVAAAGNSAAGAPPDGLARYPANFPGVIGVGAHDADGVVWNRSNFNGAVDNTSTVDISAPGIGVMSTFPLDITDPEGANDGYTNSFVGTSLAAPHVSGVAALLISAKVATTPATVWDALKCGARPETADPNTDHDARYYGVGLLDAYRAMNWNSNSNTCEVTLANDVFEAATVISTAPYTVTQPIHSLSVTKHPGDPQICGAAREQTLWYSYRPSVSGYYQISLVGSSYEPVFGVFRGSAGALTEMDCSATPPLPQKAVALQAGQTYYIAVGTNGAAVDNQILQLRLNAAMLANNVDYQENAAYIAYSGMWTRGAVAGASGSYTQQTTDLNAAANFSFRGTKFDYVRTVGPAQGQVKIWVWANGVPVDMDGNSGNGTDTPYTVDSSGAILKGNQAVTIAIPGATPGQWNSVRIMRDSTAAGVVDLDRIRTYDYDTTLIKTAITGKVDDRDARLTYTTIDNGGAWSDLKVATTVAYYGTLRETNTSGAKVTFRFTGNALTIFRMTGSAASYADMIVVIDNGVPISISNLAATDVVRPYTIDGLVTMAHVVEIRYNGTGANELQLDAVQGSTLGTLAANLNTDERSTSLAYRGLWIDQTVSGALSSTVRTLKSGSEVSFQFSGNDLCINYQRFTASSDRTPGQLQVFIDNVPMTTLTDSTGNGFVLWCLKNTALKVVPTGTHRVRLEVAAGGDFALDYLRPQTYNILTPARGLVQETDASLIYEVPTNWITTTQAVVGITSAYRPQGGYMKQTTQDNSAVTFYINGSGFILYTAMGASQGCWDITVDPVQVTGTNGSQTYQMYLSMSDIYNRPLGYGITGLDSGLHRVRLLTDNNCSTFYPGGLSEALRLNLD
ncbi:MAG TPA: S8 family serine peptidase, partial [Phototrophicaceae bacterium]|nr:S8 family serine peptidase [Phototrophicaceae bacterium]